MSKEWYSVNEVAEILGESYKKIYNLLVSGELGHYRLGRSYRIRQSDLQAYFAKQDQQLHSILHPATNTPDTLLLNTTETIPVPVHLPPTAHEQSTTGAAQPAPSPTPALKWQRLLAGEPSLATGASSASVGDLEKSGRLARQRETLYLANFQQLFHSGLAVAHPNTGEIIRLEDWSSVEQIEDDLLQLAQYLNLAVLHSEQHAGYPNNTRILYWVEPNSIGGILRKYPKQGLVIECAALSRLERFVTSGHDEEPLALSHLQQELEERYNLVQRWSVRLGAPIAYIIALASTTGWDAASIASVRAFNDSTRPIPYLVDLVDLQLYASSAHPKSADYLELFDLPLGERKFLKVQRQIREALLATSALRLSDLQAEIGCSFTLLRAAALHLAKNNADYRIFQEGSNLIIRRA